MGLIGAIVLAYLLIVVNFQSWLDPFHYHHRSSRRPGRHLLDAPDYTHHVERAFTDRRHHVHGCGHRQQHPGGFLCARTIERRQKRVGIRTASGLVRIRPVIMTALAMMIGMVPMAIGLGEGGEQNAPLGRAVIGGLLFATVATLFFVPCVFSIIHGRLETRQAPKKD